ncbi:MAG: HupE/UreJ family protein [Burkholderiaceae bacterium]
MFDTRPGSGVARSWRRATLTIAALLGFAAEAGAHAAFSDGADSLSINVFSGAAHPFVVMHHLIALIAAGLLIGRQQIQSLERAWAFGLAGLIAGIVLAKQLPEQPMMILVLALTVICSLVVILDWRKSRLVFMLAVGLIPFLVGLDSPPAPDSSLGHDLTSRFGTVLGAGALLFYPAMLAHSVTQPWHLIGVRIAASWITAISLLVLALQFAR